MLPDNHSIQPKLSASKPGDSSDSRRADADIWYHFPLISTRDRNKLATWSDHDRELAQKMAIRRSKKEQGGQNANTEAGRIELRDSNRRNARSA